MQGYGQYCPLALASEIVGERWTLLVLREVMLGSRRFNDIHRGVPRMSPALLSRRLKTLTEHGIVERHVVDGHSEYALTKAGGELAPFLMDLAIWGKRWLPATLSRERADPDLIMWDMHRHIDRESLPPGRTVVQFSFLDLPAAKRDRWIVSQRPEIDFCIKDPGYEVDLFVETDSRTITWVWYGDMPLTEAIGEGRIALHGPADLRRQFPRWMPLSPLAPYARERPVALR
ncbi:winged helix-turn-helix transcriptional regulator [Nitratireductor thuwali]|uniref:HTH-type transcriptional regulator n=1 Tax=Nitratireductor thuwali TaxID=2267699 RepID=A0ABY5MHQ0_9HYPH|nr:putative HTH-type transcriptional regulator [Nitratireductor thuwali]